MSISQILDRAKTMYSTTSQTKISPVSSSTPKARSGALSTSATLNFINSKYFKIFSIAALSTASAAMFLSLIVKNRIDPVWVVFPSMAVGGLSIALIPKETSESDTEVNRELLNQIKILRNQNDISKYQQELTLEELKSTRSTVTDLGSSLNKATLEIRSTRALLGSTATKVQSLSNTISELQDAAADVEDVKNSSSDGYRQETVQVEKVAERSSSDIKSAATPSNLFGTQPITYREDTDEDW